MKFRILSFCLILLSFLGFFFFEQNEIFVMIAIVGFTCLSLNFMRHLKARKKKATWFISICFSVMLLFGAPLLTIINIKLAFALYVEGVFSIILPIFLSGGLIFDIFKPKLVMKFAASDDKEFEREDGVLFKSVTFFQSIFFILYGLELLKTDNWFIASLLTANILFFVFRGYAIIKKSNINRYRSIVTILIFPALDVLFVFRDSIREFVPIYTELMGVPIPISLTVLSLTIMIFGLSFSLLRVMLLTRYELAEEVFF